MEFGLVTMLCLQCIVSIPISGLGIPVVPLVYPTPVHIVVVLLNSVLLPGILTTSSENASLDRRFELSVLLLKSR